MDIYLEQHNLQHVDSGDSIRGRYIRNTQKIPKGTVLITSQPLATVALPQTSNEFCNYCFQKQRMLQRCSRCKSAYFCSKSCFQNSWLSYHQFACSKSSQENTESYLDLEMLEKVALNVARYRKLRSANEIAKEIQSETAQVTMEAFFSLMGHDHLQPTHQGYKQLAERALQKPYIRETGIQLQELIHYLNVFKSNNFTIDDSEMFAVGEGTYPIASLFNHSCRANAIFTLDGAHAEIRAIEDIEPYTEITISYLDAAHSRTYRKKTLREKYFFDCQCVRCQPHAGLECLSHIDDLLGEEQDEWHRAQQLLGTPNTQVIQLVENWDFVELFKKYNWNKGERPETTKPLNLAHYTHYFAELLLPCLINDMGENKMAFNDILRTAIDQIASYPRSDFLPYTLVTLSSGSRLFYDFMAEGYWSKAACLGMYILVQYSLIYPSNHPILAQHYLTLAKATWNANVQLPQHEKTYQVAAKRWIMLAKQTIPVAFGKNSSLWKETLELERIEKEN